MSHSLPPLQHRRYFSQWVKFGFPLLSLFLLWLLWHEVPILFSSLIISIGIYYILNPLVDMLEARSLSRTAASILVIIGFIALIYFIWMRFLTFSADVRSSLDLDIFQKNLMTKVQQTFVWAETKAPILKRFIEPEVTPVQIPKSKKTEAVTSEHPRIAAKIERFIEKQIVDWAPNVAVKLASSLLNLILIPYFTFFLLKDGRTFKKTIIHWIPNKYFEPSLKFFYEMDRRIRTYFQSLLLDCSLVGVLVGVGSSMVGAPYPAIFGLIAFVLNSIPLFGPLLYSCICLIITIGVGKPSGVILGLLGVFLLSRVLDDLVFIPTIYGKSHHIHPVVVLCAVLIGETVAGIWGMFLAIPILSILFLGIHIVREISVGEEAAPLPPSAFAPFA